VRSTTLWNFVFTGLLAGLVVAARYVTARGPAGWWAFLAAGAAIGFAGWWWVGRPVEVRGTRGILGQCERCGYDLTGNVSGVCPECGTNKSLEELAVAGALVVVFRFHDEDDACRMAATLDGVGVESLVTNRMPLHCFPYGATLAVRPADASRAATALMDMPAGAPRRR
jgi:hypothetical protein